MDDLSVLVLGVVLFVTLPFAVPIGILVVVDRFKNRTRKKEGELK